MAKGQKKQKQETIDKKTFENLCAIQCTAEEVCCVLGICRLTLESWCKNTYDGKTFKEVFDEKRLVGKASLRRRQWNLSEKSVPMAIWLGKQYLGQTDKQDVSVNKPVEDLTPLVELLKGNK